MSRARLLATASAGQPASRTPGSHILRRASLAAVGMMVAIATFVGTEAPANAHDALGGTNPPDASTVEVPPSLVELTFNEEPLEVGADVQVTAPDGRIVDAGPPMITGAILSQPLVPDLPAGLFQILWRVTSSDGHPISGELSFTAANSGTQPPAPGPTQPEPTPTVEPSSEPSPTVTGPAPSTQQAGTQDEADRSSSTVVPWVIGGVVVAGAAAWAARRRAARNP